MTEIKPCPFCGGEAYVLEGFTLYEVACDYCHCRTPVEYSKEKVIELWNRRTSDDTQ